MQNQSDLLKADYYFDQQDRTLLKMINSVMDEGYSASTEEQVFNTVLHPHGIQNLANSRVFRMAFAVLNLLGNLDKAGVTAQERLQALKVLREEVLHSAHTTFRFNTARVLIQIMKEIVRARGDEYAQLCRIHDFRRAAGGNPRIVRHFLKEYYLLEMPEAWNQKTFDDHVHDSNTQGRKNATYLIMDAWVKGIRRLTVVYYNYVEPEVAKELLEAAEIMGITVRVGLKLKALFRGRYAEFLWSPKGFSGTPEFLKFLNSTEVEAFQTEGRRAEDWAKTQIFASLAKFNSLHAPQIADALGIEVPAFTSEEFDEFLAGGQSSLLRLAEFIYRNLYPLLKARAEEVQEQLKCAAGEEKEKLSSLLCTLEGFTANEIHNLYLAPNLNSEIPCVERPGDDDRPSLLRMTIPELAAHLRQLRVGSRLTLLLGGLTAKDVLQILWEAKGAVTDLELFNMKEWQDGRLTHIKDINALQAALNHGNILTLKPILLKMVQEIQDEGDSARAVLFTEILANMPKLQHYYSNQPLGSRIGTDCTSNLGTRYGMGIAVLDTLPPSVAKSIRCRETHRPTVLPLKVKLSVFDRYRNVNSGSGFVRWVRNNLGWTSFGLKVKREWSAGLANALYSENGNMITMGGLVEENKNGFIKEEVREVETNKKKVRFDYLNTNIVNITKVALGFIPAFITFMLTQDWWVLAWFGALLWFSITGVRNVIQAIVSGGLKKNMLLSRKKLIDWSRISDSLMYTGLSVVLLEGIMRNVVLGKVLGLTVDTAPLLVFSIIALANGIYISSHNIFRGFPKTAVVGNLFRSVLAIPVAMVYNSVLGTLIPLISSLSPEAVLVPAAAIVSKFASDTVAGVIESTADHKNNERLRAWDYSNELKRLFDCYGRLEIAFPEKDVFDLLKEPKEFIALTAKDARKLEIEAIMISLDLMYFWYYLPCAQQVLVGRVRSMSADEKAVFLHFQGVLSDYQEVSRLFLDGMLGENFSTALAFYLDNHTEYLDIMERICNGRTK